MVRGARTFDDGRRSVEDDVRINYLEGDPCSPKYVRGAMRHSGLDVQMPEKDSPSLPQADVHVLSDVPANHLSESAAGQILESVQSGAGLLVVGGWTSLGRGGYARHRFAPILPCELEDGDDRENVPAGLYLFKREDHELLEGLPWQQPIVLTGFNRVRPREGARVLLEARRVERLDGDAARLGRDAVPILLLGGHGRGRVGVLATDLAPHWSGGWTDWGPPSVDVGEGEELGIGYVTFVTRLCRWLAAA